MSLISIYFKLAKTTAFQDFFLRKNVLFVYLQGVREYSEPIGLETKVKCDLVVIGSVAITKTGKYY